MTDTEKYTERPREETEETVHLYVCLDFGVCQLKNHQKAFMLLRWIIVFPYAFSPILISLQIF